MKSGGNVADRGSVELELDFHICISSPQSEDVGWTLEPERQSGVAADMRIECSQARLLLKQSRHSQFFVSLVVSAHEQEN